jgi:hypothetical protein
VPVPTPAAIASLVVLLIPPACVLAGVVVPLVWRHRAIAAGYRVTALRSVIAVVNGVAVGVVAAVLLGLTAFAVLYPAFPGRP